MKKEKNNSKIVGVVKTLFRIAIIIDTLKTLSEAVESAKEIKQIKQEMNNKSN